MRSGTRCHHKKLIGHRAHCPPNRLTNRRALCPRQPFSAFKSALLLRQAWPSLPQPSLPSGEVTGMYIP
ncbi:unnamed protein product [Protopolystoma xenopodis]|uniref:Uncharacterized protein n=1 Tax=Protopolystoma xenopodis TaxID=117903 RepID=A0A3S4ZWY7_9PLAT|nr:unnamed protein product [Protopolystoma xenopodis]